MQEESHKYHHFQLIKIFYNPLKLFTTHYICLILEKGTLEELYLLGKGIHSVFLFLPTGYSNTGTRPQIALAQIRHLLGYSTTGPDHTDETMLGNVMKENQTKH